jgi:hypothetical protein
MTEKTKTTTKQPRKIESFKFSAINPQPGSATPNLDGTLRAIVTEVFYSDGLT